MMLVPPGGRERTAAGFAALYRAAGRRLTRVLPTSAPAVLWRRLRPDTGGRL